MLAGGQERGPEAGASAASWEAAGNIPPLRQKALWRIARDRDVRCSDKCHVESKSRYNGQENMDSTLHTCPHGCHLPIAQLSHIYMGNNPCMPERHVPVSSVRARSGDTSDFATKCEGRTGVYTHTPEKSAIVKSRFSYAKSKCPSSHSPIQVQSKGKCICSARHSCLQGKLCFH